MTKVTAQEEIWVPGSIFILHYKDSDYHGQECEFLGWDKDEDNWDEDYNYRYPRMKFKDGYIEDWLWGERYEFLRHNEPLYCKSLL